MASLLEEPDRHSPSANLAWRVITLVNLFRLLVPLLLIALLLTISPSPVGQTQPAVFVGALTAYFLFALGMIPSIKARWPQIGLQTSITIGVDIMVLTLITYASGGMNSGLAALLVLPCGSDSVCPLPPSQRSRCWRSR
jgi:two-component system sensor histidine kinase PilS (NtrC family)